MRLFCFNHHSHSRLIAFMYSYRDIAIVNSRKLFKGRLYSV